MGKLVGAVTGKPIAARTGYETPKISYEEWKRNLAAGQGAAAAVQGAPAVQRTAPVGAAGDNSAAAQMARDRAAGTTVPAARYGGDGADNAARAQLARDRAAAIEALDTRVKRDALTMDAGDLKQAQRRLRELRSAEKPGPMARDLAAVMLALDEEAQRAAVSMDAEAMTRVRQRQRELRAQTGRQTLGDRVGSGLSAVLSGSGASLTNLAGTAVEALGRGIGTQGRSQAVQPAQATQDNIDRAIARMQQGKTAEELARMDRLLRLNEEWKKEQTAQAEAAEDRLRGAAEKIYGAADRMQDDAAAHTEAAKAGLGKFGQYAVDAGISVGQSTLDGLVGAATGTGLAPFAARAFGGATQEARRGGANLDEQLVYGAAEALKEYATEKLFGLAVPQKLAGSGSFGSVDEGIEKTIRYVTERMAKSEAGQKALGGLLTWGAGGLTEGLEEGIGDVAENLVINPYLRGWDPDTRTGREKLDDAIEDMLVGGLSGLMGLTNVLSYDAGQSGETGRGGAQQDAERAETDRRTDTPTAAQAGTQGPAEAAVQAQPGPDPLQQDMEQLFGKNVAPRQTVKAAQAREVTDIAAAQEQTVRGDPLQRDVERLFGRKTDAPGLVRNGYAGQLKRREAALYDRMARAVGVRLELVESIADGTGNAGAANGVYDRESRTVRIAMDADAPLRAVAAHEITHRLQELAPEEYGRYLEYAKQYLAERTGAMGGMDALTAAKVEEYARHGVELTREQAMDEIGADFTRELVENAELFRQLERQDRGMARRILDALRDFIRRVKGAFTGQAERNAAARSAFGADLEQLERAATLWQGAFDTAAKVARRGTEQTFNAAGQTENAARMGGGAQYSLKAFADGTPFVDVDTDQARFDGLTTAQMQTEAKKVILESFRGKVIGSDYTVYVNKNSAEHYAYPANRRMEETQKQDKMRASPELDNILSASVFRENVPDDGRHPAAVGGLDKLDTVFRVNGRLYRAEITVLVTGRGRVFYDMTKFDDITGREIGQTQRVAETSNDAVEDTVSRNGEEVKGEFSLKGGGEYQRELLALSRENEALRKRGDYFKNQMRRSGGTKADRVALQRGARALLETFGVRRSRENTAEAAAVLEELYAYLNSDGADGQEAVETAKAYAKDLMERVDGMEKEDWETVTGDTARDAELKRYLRSTAMTLDARVRENVTDYELMRRANMGRLRLVDGANNTDTFVEELIDAFPEVRDFFPAGSVEGEGAVAAVMELAERLYEKPFGQGNPFVSREEMGAYAGREAELARMLEERGANEVLNAVFDLAPAKETWADRQAARHARELADQRERSRERMRAALADQRERLTREARETKERYTERQRQDRERREAQGYREKIARSAWALGRKVARPTDKSHVPEALRQPAAALLASINLESGFELQYGKDARYSRVAPGSVLDGERTRRTELWREMRDRLAALAAEGELTADPALFGDAAEGIQGSFDAVMAMGDKRLDQMDREELQTVWRTLRAVEQAAVRAGETLATEKYARTEQWAADLHRSLWSRRPRSGNAARMALDLETPYTFFFHFGEAGREAYRTLRRAQDKKTVFTAELAEKTGEICDGKTVKRLEEETRTFTLESGEELTLTAAQVMDLYNLWGRAQAREHILTGGLRQPEIRSGKGRTDRGGMNLKTTAADVETILRSMTDEEARIAGALQRLTATELAEFGNEASMDAYGYRKFTEKHYWPIHTVRETLHYSAEKGDGRARAIKNTGMAQALTPHAGNAVELGSVFETFSRHASDMAEYGAWLCPIEDLNRLFNYQYRNGRREKTGETVKDLLESRGGKGTQQYWRKLMEDIQNGISTPNDTGLGGLFEKGVGSFKGAAVGANVRVVIQQPTAYFRAAAVLDPRSMARGLAAGATKGNAWEKAKRYAPIALQKDMGGFDIAQPRTMYQNLFNRRSGLERVNDAAGAAAGAADALTWGRLWNASEWEAVRLYPELERGSEAFYRQTAEIFSEMVDASQVVDGVLQRSQIMRSKNAVTKQATAFMGEPVMSLNMVMRTWEDFRAEKNGTKRAAARRQLGRAAAALGVNCVANAFAQSLADAMRSAGDDDKKYWERVWTAFTGISGDEETAGEKWRNFLTEGNIADNLNPLGNIPFVKDILSICQGYDVSRTEMEVISDVVQAGQTFIDSFGPDGRKTRAYALRGVAVSLAKLFGVPLQNLTRDLWAAVRTAAAETDNTALQFELEKAVWNLSSERNKGRYLDILYRCLEQGDLETYGHIRRELQAEMGLGGKEIEDGMKNRYRAAVKKDAAYTLPQTAADLLGKWQTVGTGDPDEEKWTVEDLDAAGYEGYTRRRGELIADMRQGMENSRDYGQLDAADRESVMETVYDLAEKLTRWEVSGGECDTPQWVLNAAEAEEKYGVNLETFALLKTQADGVESLKDRDGKTVENSRGLQVMEIVYRTGGLTDKQRAAMAEYLGAGKDVRGLSRTEVAAELERMRREQPRGTGDTATARGMRVGTRRAPARTAETRGTKERDAGDDALIHALREAGTARRREAVDKLAGVMIGG